MRVLSIIGTRPEAIKMAPVVSALQKLAPAVESQVCWTGQHQEMVEPVFRLFGVRPDFTLETMRAGQGLTKLTARLLEALDQVLTVARPDWILAQGDTTSVLAASLAAFYHGIRFGHVEAGLRTEDRFDPFPEEVNRRVADMVADLHFAPTLRCQRELLAAGYPEQNIKVTGNTVIDALLWIADLPYDPASGPLKELGEGERLVLVTAHRRENQGTPLVNICQAVRQLAERFGPDGIRFLFPVHMNPQVRRVVMECLQGVEHVRLVDPLDYLTLVNVLKRCCLLLTDSGGLQEEAPAFGVPVLVLRATTERPEGLRTELAELVGTDSARIVAAASRRLQTPQQPGCAALPYGDGKAAGRIARALCQAGPRSIEVRASG